MHPRNVFKIRPPNYEELAKKYPSIRAKCFIGAGGKICLDFNDLEAIRLINEILLLEYFEIDVKISPNVLVPRIPQKLNYILLIEDLINQNILQNNQIFGLDIGTGTSCIYPILGAALNQWKFVGTDILEGSIQKAAENVKRNSLEHSIHLFLNKQKDSIFKGIFSLDEYSRKNFTFSMCNPPFFDPQEGEEKFIKGNKSSYQNIDNKNTKRGPPSSATTALEEEIFFQGGELCFVQQMIEESQQFPHKILIYTTMIGKLTSLKKLKRILEEKQIKYMYYQLSQGRTQRWVLAWTFSTNIIFKKE